MREYIRIYHDIHCIVILFCIVKPCHAALNSSWEFYFRTVGEHIFRFILLLSDSRLYLRIPAAPIQKAGGSVMDWEQSSSIFSPNSKKNNTSNDVKEPLSKTSIKYKI